LNYQIFDPDRLPTTQTSGRQHENENHSQNPPDPPPSINPTDGHQPTTETRLVLVSESLIDLHQQALDAIYKVTEATAARMTSLPKEPSK
jgi:hypothetical protein